MGVAASGATLEIQLVADVARLQRDMRAMQAVVDSTTASAGKSFAGMSATSVNAATQMATAAQQSARAAVGMAGGLKQVGMSGANARIVTLEMFHVTRSLTEQLATGVSPARAFATQIGRISTAVQYSGGGMGGLIKQFAQWIGIIKVTQNAELAAAAATTLASAVGLKSIAERARATVAARDAQVTLIKAEVEGAASAELQAAATQRLIKALRQLELATGKAALANGALATAEGEAAAAAELAKGASIISLGTIGSIAVVVLPLLALIGTAFLGIKQGAEAADPGAKQLIATLGLTEEQIKKLKDTSVTWGDVFGATLDVLLEKAGISAKGIKEWFTGAFHSITEFGKFSIAVIIAAFAALGRFAYDTFTRLPAMIGEGVIGAANLALAGIEKLINLSITGINGLADMVNHSLLGRAIQQVFGVQLPTIAGVSLGRLQNMFAGTTASIAADVKGTFFSTYRAVQGTFDAISARADQRRDERIRTQADAMKKADDSVADSTGRATRAHHDRAQAAKDEADALEKLRLKIEDLWRAQQKVTLDAATPPARLEGPDIKTVLPDLPDYGKQILDMLKAIADQAQVTGQSLADAFGKPGEVLAGMLVNLAGYAEAQQKLSDDVAAGTTTQQAAEKQLATIRAHAIGTTLAGLKSLFKEHSTGYRIMTAIEKAYAVFQAVQSALAIAREFTKTATTVAQSGVRTTANTAEGGSKIFAELGPWAFPVVAAMVAVLAALGASAGGGGGGGASIPNVDDLQAKQGAGTVLGDAAAKSESIARSLDLMSKNSVQGLNYSADMVRSLRMIESGISKLAGNIARDIQVGNMFDTSKLKLGTFGTKGFLGLGGSSQLRELADQGIVISGTPLSLASHYKNQASWDAAMGQVGGASVADILKNGLYGASYTRTNESNTRSGIFGMGGGSSSGVDYDTGSLSASILSAFTDVIGSIRDNILKAADVIGLQGAQALVDAFQVKIGQISFEGMSGKEIEDQLNAVFSSIGDQMTEAVFPALKDLQKVGEGLFETFMRVAKDYATIDAALSSIGMSFGAVGVASLAARERLIDLSGGLDEFVSQTDYFFDHFFSEADKIAFAQGQVNDAFAQLGIAAPDTLAQFKALVQGLDLSTAAGQDMFAALMTIAPAFYQVDQAVQQLADKRIKMQIQLLQAEGDAVGALALQRQQELAALDESLRGLQQQIYAAQDLAKAKDNLLGAYKRESGELQSTADRFHKFADDLKSYRDSLFSSAGGPASYNQALIDLLKQSGLAAGGDETALGGGLRTAAQTFLSIAEQNAGSAQDLARARALVARQLDQAIGGAEGKASLAEQQLDQLKDQVGKLIDIDDHVLSVAEALEQLNALLAAPPPPSAAAFAGAAPPVAEGSPSKAQERSQATLESIQTAVETGTVSINKVARVLDQANRGGALAVYTDADSPLAVDGVVGSTLS